MGKLLWPLTMSLDGFIAGPGGATDWMARYVGPNTAVDEVIRTTGAVLSGRRSYNASKQPGRKIFGGGVWSGPVFVLTDCAPDDEEDSTVIFLSDDIREVVATAFQAAGEKNVVLVGANIAQQCISLGLVDEIHIYLAPLLLGDGIRFFGDPGRRPVALEPISVTRTGPITNLRYRVVKRKIGWWREREK